MPALEHADKTQSATSQQPNRLIDRFGRAHTYLRISVTDRCNLRCTYCMPPEGIDWKNQRDLLTNEEILRIAGVFTRMGVEKIRITGGEPLLRANLLPLMKDLNDLPDLKTLAMTTNGLLLETHVEALKHAGLSALNISLDTLRRERFLEISRRDSLETVLRGLDAALQIGFESLKLNVVVMAGINEDEILDFVRFAENKPLNVRFIEYMPFKQNNWSQADVFPYERMKALIEREFTLQPKPAEVGAVAKDYALVGHPGSVSFITSMTDSFCGSCNRLRLTADGQIKACLFQAAEINVRDVLRNGIHDAELETLISQAVLGKQEAHPPMEELLSVDNRTMIEIGG